MSVLWACCAVGCVEIDPSYGESYVASTGSSPTGTDASASSTGPVEGSSASGDPLCDCGPWELCESGTCTAPARILFINLDGATTVFGVADASMDSHNLFPELEGAWPGYSDDQALRQALMDAIAAQWAPFRVVVTEQRPEPTVTTPYMMAIVTADPPPAGFEGTPWIAFPDCGDTIPQDVAFVFAAPGSGSAQDHANITSQALGRAFGLQLTSSPDDITGFGAQFVDACIARSEDPPCAAHDPEFCGGDATQQNSFRELEALLGLRP